MIVITFGTSVYNFKLVSVSVLACQFITFGTSVWHFWHVSVPLLARQCITFGTPVWHIWHVSRYPYMLSSIMSL